MCFKTNICSHIIVILYVYIVIINRAEGYAGKTTNPSEEENKTVFSLIDSSTASTISTKWFPKIFTRLHGCVLVIGWLGLTPISILIARYYKHDINSRNPGLGQLWFKIHRILMYINLVLNILGAIFIYMRVGGWSGAQFHTVLGLIVMSSVFVQTFVSTFFRPAINSSKRWIFNWSHFFIGNFCFIISIITIYCSLDYGVLKTRRNQLLWLMNIIVVLTIITIIVFEIYNYYNRRNGLWIRKLDDKEIRVKSEKLESKSVPLKRLNMNSLFKIWSLLTIVIAISICTTALCVYIMDP